MNFWARGEIARVQIVLSESEVLCLKISVYKKNKRHCKNTVSERSHSGLKVIISAVLKILL
jgi:hypothetical protein